MGNESRLARHSFHLIGYKDKEGNTHLAKEFSYSNRNRYGDMPVKFGAQTIMIPTNPHTPEEMIRKDDPRFKGQPERRKTDLNGHQEEQSIPEQTIYQASSEQIEAAAD